MNPCSRAFTWLLSAIHWLPSTIHPFGYISRFIRYLQWRTVLKSGFLNRCGSKPTTSHCSYRMDENLNIICQFADTVASTIKRFAELCREEKRRREAGISEFGELQNELIKERKKRMELEEMVRRAGNLANDPSLADLLNTHEERRLPRTSFTLFLADYRERIMKEQPRLTLETLTNIAKAKWKLLKPEQRDDYDRKLEELKRVHAQRGIVLNKHNADQHLVKREFAYENEAEKENEGNRDEEAEEGNNAEEEQELNREMQPDERPTHVQATMPASLGDQSLPSDPEPPREKSAIENILDLYHTQQKTHQDEAQPPCQAEYQMSLVQRPLQDDPTNPEDAPLNEAAPAFALPPAEQQ